MLEAVAVVGTDDYGFGTLCELLHRWRIAHWDLSSFIKQSIDNFAIGFSEKPKFIQDYKDLNPYRPISEKAMETVNKSQPEPIPVPPRPVVWNPYG